MPKRIQRKRSAKWRKPEGVIYVGRGSAWGNPYICGGNKEEAVECFRQYSLNKLAREPHWLDPLRGKDLMCWCAEDAPFCHADVLLRLANQ